MATPAQGVGFLIVNDLLSSVSYSLFEPVVNTLVPAGGISAGAQTVAVFDPAMYVGAQIIIGKGTENIEVVTITAVVAGTSFSAVFADTHVAGESIIGATFPVRMPTDPLFTQPEMLAYLATAYSDFLLDCPLVYEIDDAITVVATKQIAALPSDCMVPMRIATDNYPLRETSQNNLDGYDFRWQQQEAIQPRAYFRDKVGLQNFGIWPRQNNNVICEVVYQQRGPETFGLADGFSLPDAFLLYVKCRLLSFAYSKDGEARSPALARYWDSRYQFGVKVSKMLLGVIEDSNVEMAQ